MNGEPYTEFTLIESFDFSLNYTQSIEGFIEKLKMKYLDYYVEYVKHDFLIDTINHNYEPNFSSPPDNKPVKMNNSFYLYKIVIEFRLKSKLKHKLDQI